MALAAGRSDTSFDRRGFDPPGAEQLAHAACVAGRVWQCAGPQRGAGERGQRGGASACRLDVSDLWRERALPGRRFADGGFVSGQRAAAAANYRRQLNCRRIGE